MASGDSKETGANIMACAEHSSQTVLFSPHSQPDDHGTGKQVLSSGSLDNPQTWQDFGVDEHTGGCSALPPVPYPPKLSFHSNKRKLAYFSG